MDDINLEPLAQEKHSGSRFYGYTARVYGFLTLDKIYLRLRQQHLGADHIMLGYRLVDPDSPEQCVEGSCHDGESHSDTVLAQAVESSLMKNVAVFVVRYSGTTPLRGLRLKLIADCATNALQKLRYPPQDPSMLEQATTGANPPVAENSSETSRSTPQDHLYGRSSPQKQTGCGGPLMTVGRHLHVFNSGKCPRLDYASSMAYSLDSD